jgi:hypothetical protein
LKRKRFIIIYIVLIGFCTLLAIGFAEIIFQRRHRPHEWDLSTSHRITQVPWPKNRPPWDDFADFDINGPVLVLFPRGKKFDGRANVVVFSKTRNQISSVQLYLEKQNAVDAYKSAVTMAKYWDLDPAALDGWFARAKGSFASYSRGTPIHFAVHRNRAEQPVSLEIFNSGDAEKPFYISLVVNWKVPP